MDEQAPSDEHKAASSRPDLAVSSLAKLGLDDVMAHQSIACPSEIVYLHYLVCTAFEA
jgi:hypothetical protein